MRTILKFILLMSSMLNIKNLYAKQESLSFEIEPLPAIDEMPNPTPWMLAKVMSAGDDLFYGTATLFALDDSNYYFVTNAHVLPTQKEQWQDLLLVSPIKKYDEQHFEVRGISFGHDIAVLALPRASSDLGQQDQLKNLLKRSFDFRDIVGHEYEIGVEGFSGKPSFRQQKKPTYRSANRNDDLLVFGQYPFNDTPYLSTPVKLELRTDCPPVFLRNCFHIPLETEGYSGGILIGFSPNSPVLRIIGIVSHFEPLANRTFVIPLEEALAVAHEIKAKGAHGFIVLTEDPTGTFRQTAADKIHVLKGSLAGQVIRGNNERVGGGHESIGGGHESIGGGHESMPGGADDSSARATIYETFSESFSFLGSAAELEQDMKEPRNWQNGSNSFGVVLAKMNTFRGILASLRYKAGVFASAEKEHFELKSYFNNQFTPNLRAFAKSYLQDPGATWTNSVERDSFPLNQILKSESGEKRGATVYKYHLISDSEVLPERVPLPPTPIRNGHPEPRMPFRPGGGIPTIVERETLKPLLESEQFKNGNKDILIGKGQGFGGRPVDSLTLEVLENGMTQIKIVAPTWNGNSNRFVSTTLILPKRPELAGHDLYVYEGDAKMQIDVNKWNRRSEHSFVRLMIQKSDLGFELKLISAYQSDWFQEETDYDVEKWHLEIESFYSVLK